MNKRKLIDHTVLKAVTTKDDVKKLCFEAIEFGFKSVCINPCFISYASELLKDSDVLVCTVIGFPLGANTIATKVYETKNAILEGADECDIVINIGRVKAHDYDYVEQELKEFVLAANGKTTKVIIETCYLTDEEKVEASLCAKRAGATFVKTSTGFGTGGATPADVAIMRKAVGPNMGVKASGGVKNSADLDAMIEVGATRIGTSRGCSLFEGEK